MRIVDTSLIASILALLLVAGPGGVLAAAAEFPLPKDVQVKQPGPDVPANRAAYSGSWEGKWDGEAPILYVIEQIHPDGTAIIVYSWADYSRWDWRGGHERNVGTFKDDALVFTNRAPTPRPCSTMGECAATSLARGTARA